MRIIDDCEVFEPNECLFSLVYDPDNSSELIVYVTDKATWDERGVLNDCFADHSMPEGAMPDKIWNLMEAAWETTMSLDDARTAMLGAGFVESKEMTEWLEVGQS